MLLDCKSSKPGRCSLMLVELGGVAFTVFPAGPVQSCLSDQLVGWHSLLKPAICLLAVLSAAFGDRAMMASVRFLI